MMNRATVSALFAFWCVIACCAAATADRGAFGYPDDEHVIITHHGPMRYQPVTAVQMNRPYDDAQMPGSARRGYYKAEVIPLDMNTWKPVRQSDDGLAGRATVRGGGGRFVNDAVDVPLSAGYSVRPTAVVRRRRRNDYILTGRPPSSHGYFAAQKYSAGVRLLPRPHATGLLWTF